MAQYKKIIRQTISSTNIDSQGEKQTKEFLEKLCSISGKRIPLNQQHDMRRESIGYIENFKVVPDKSHHGEWLLIGDVYFTCKNIDEALKGFSYSYTEIFDDSESGREYQIYISYPYYNNDKIIDCLKNDKEITLGKLYKKAADPYTVSLIFAGLSFVLSPLWNIAFTNHILPSINKLITKLRPLWKKGLNFDFVQIVTDNNNHKIKIFFIPDRNSEENSYNPSFIEDGIDQVYNYLERYPEYVTKGLDDIKLYFNLEKRKYQIFYIKFIDGSDVNIIN